MSYQLVFPHPPGVVWSTMSVHKVCFYGDGSSFSYTCANILIATLKSLSSLAGAAIAIMESRIFQSYIGSHESAAQRNANPNVSG